MAEQKFSALKSQHDSRYKQLAVGALAGVLDEFTITPEDEEKEEARRKAALKKKKVEGTLRTDVLMNYCMLRTYFLFIVFACTPSDEFLMDSTRLCSKQTQTKYMLRQHQLNKTNYDEQKQV